MTRLSDMLEGLVIEFGYDEENGIFQLVGDVPSASGDGLRTFACVRCIGVSTYRRKIPDARWRDTRLSYASRDSEVAFVVQHADRCDGPNGVELGFDFGVNLGSVQLACLEFGISTLLARAEERGESWVYRDEVTGQVIDFYSPFGS